MEGQGMPMAGTGGAAAVGTHHLLRDAGSVS